VPQELPSFDLVVATVGRIGELARLLASVEAGVPQLRVIVVDQSGDNRLAKVLESRGLELLHLRSEPGLSRARNVGLDHLSADLVAFPDDDCVYPPGLLLQIAERLASDPDLDGLTGRPEDASGDSSASWKTDAAVLTDDNLWNRAISYTIFLRRAAVERSERSTSASGSVLRSHGRPQRRSTT
jgi:glycosyltransferase involved in cell wall biosynthesis